MEYRDKEHAQAVLDQQIYNRQFDKAFWNPDLETEANNAVLNSTYFDPFNTTSWSNLLGLGISGGKEQPITSPAITAGGSVTVDYRAIDDAINNSSSGTDDDYSDLGYSDDYNDSVFMEEGGQISQGLDNLYMNRRDSKQKLDGMIGIQSRQYGGGLDDAYMNRRSAFAAPDANSAFASPMGRGGLPTIYRAKGSDYEADDYGNYSQEDLDAAMADPIDMNAVSTYGKMPDPLNRSKDEEADERDEGYSQYLGLSADRISREGFGPLSSYLDSLYKKTGSMDAAKKTLGRALTLPGTIPNLQRALDKNELIGGSLLSTFDDAVEKGATELIGPELLELAKDTTPEEKKNVLESIIDKVGGLATVTGTIDPDKENALNKGLERVNGKFTPANSFAAGLVNLGIPMLGKVATKGGEKHIGTIELEGLTFTVGNKGTLGLDLGAGMPGRDNAEGGYNYEPETEIEKPIEETITETDTEKKPLTGLDVLLDKRKNKKVSSREKSNKYTDELFANLYNNNINVG